MTSIATCAFLQADGTCCATSTAAVAIAARFCEEHRAVTRAAWRKYKTFTTLARDMLSLDPESVSVEHWKTVYGAIARCRKARETFTVRFVHPSRRDAGHVFFSRHLDQLASHVESRLWTLFQAASASAAASAASVAASETRFTSSDVSEGGDVENDAVAATVGDSSTKQTHQTPAASSTSKSPSELAKKRKRKQRQKFLATIRMYESLNQVEACWLLIGAADAMNVVFFHFLDWWRQHHAVLKRGTTVTRSPVKEEFERVAHTTNALLSACPDKEDRRALVTRMKEFAHLHSIRCVLILMFLEWTETQKGAEWIWTRKKAEATDTSEQDDTMNHLVDSTQLLLSGEACSKRAAKIIRGTTFFFEPQKGDATFQYLRLWTEFAHLLDEQLSAQPVRRFFGMPAADIFELVFTANPPLPKQSESPDEARPNALWFIQQCARILEGSSQPQATTTVAEAGTKAGASSTAAAVVASSEIAEARPN